MSEIWLAIEIYPKDYAAQRIAMLLDFVKPTLERLENEGLTETFHFLFEPGHVLFRARTADVEKRCKVKSIADENLAKIKETISNVEFKEDYMGEQDQFGIEGWLYVQKLLEYSSRISLLKQETLAAQKPWSVCRLDREFNEAKLVHCFLNAQGLSIVEEANFHNQANIERLLRAYGFFSVVQRLQVLEKKVVGDKSNS